MFSFVPLLYIALTVAGFFLNDALVVQQLFFQLERTLGAETAKFLQELLTQQAQQRADQSILASLLSFAILLFFASGMFATLEDMLNLIWRNPFPAKQGVLHIVRTQLLAFVLVIGVGLLFVAITVVSFVLQALGNIFNLDIVLFLTNGLVLFAITTLTFALLYRVLARVKAPWRFTLLGALVAAVLFTFGRWLFALYLQLSHLDSAFAAASTLAVMLLAIYYAALIFLVGAIMIRVFAEAFDATRAATRAI
jgi:membrane protein